MAQPSVSLQSQDLAKPLSLKWQGIGLKWKIAGAFGTLLFLSVAVVIGIVYHFTGRALRAQLEKRANLIATNLSDVAAGELIAKNPLELHALTTKYARIDGVAYVFIRDAKGEVVAHSLGSFPPELEPPESASETRLSRRREVTWRGKSVLETQLPILDGQIGSVHVGIWTDTIQSQVLSALLPQIVSIVITFAVLFLISLALAGNIIQPILRLRIAADRISRGELDTSVELQANNEIGDLAASLERMRASLKAAMNRLKANRL